MKCKKLHSFVGTAIILLCLSNQNAKAFVLSPMVQKLNTQQSKSLVFTVENKNKEKIAVSLEIQARSYDEKGNETRKPTEDFSIYPDQLALQAGEKRNIRLTWTKPETSNQELAYRLIASQLPVNLADKPKATSDHSAKINFLLQYVASIYIEPSEPGKYKLHIDSFKNINENDASIKISNTGNIHKVLYKAKLRFFNGESLIKEISGIEALESVNLLAGEYKEIKIKAKEKLPIGFDRVVVDSENSGD